MNRSAVHFRKRVIDNVDYSKYEAILRWDIKEYPYQTNILKRFETPKKLTEFVMSLVSERPVSEEITEIRDYLKQMFESGRLVLQDSDEQIQNNNEVLDFVAGF